MPHLAAGVFVHPFTHIVDIVVNDEKLLAPRDLRLNLGVQTGGWSPQARAFRAED